MNTITIELCAEDRARLDRIIEGLQLAIMPKAEAELAAQTQKTTPKTEEEKPHENAPAETETTADHAKHEETEQERPSVTLEQIQQKVIQLCAANGGANKAKVRDIVTAHSKTVTDLPMNKWAEVWKALTALEG